MPRRYATQAAKEEQERRRAQYQEQLRRQQEEAEAQRQQQQQQQQQESTISEQQQQQTPPGTPLASGVSTPDMSGSGSALQIIGMSATLPNVDQVAAWLDAVLYQTDFRPVQLRQYVKLGRALKDQAGQVRGGCGGAAAGVASRCRCRFCVLSYCRSDRCSLLPSRCSALLW